MSKLPSLLVFYPTRFHFTSVPVDQIPESRSQIKITREPVKSTQTLKAELEHKQSETKKHKNETQNRVRPRQVCKYLVHFEFSGSFASNNFFSLYNRKIGKYRAGLRFFI